MRTEATAVLSIVGVAITVASSTGSPVSLSTIILLIVSGRSEASTEVVCSSGCVSVAYPSEDTSSVDSADTPSRR